MLLSIEGSEGFALEPESLCVSAHVYFSQKENSLGFNVFRENDGAFNHIFAFVNESKDLPS